MPANAYVLAWTMNDFTLLKSELDGLGLSYESDGNDIRVHVPYARIGDAAALFQKHFNAPYNYVDLQYPASRLTVIVFQERVFLIRNADEDRIAKDWAVARGLPPEQADWGVSFREPA